MSVQFILNTGDQDATSKLLEKSIAWLDKNEKNVVFYLVPNHVKFETEINVLRQMHEHSPYDKQEYMASMRLQVFSFSRLAWFFMQYTEDYQQTRLSESGKFMMVRKVLSDCQTELKVFSKEIDRPGFIQQLVDLFNELQGGNISEYDFKETLKSFENYHVAEDSLLKLQDIELVYQKYLEYLSRHNIADEELIYSLSNYLKLEDVSNVQFIVTGFSNFTAVERELIETLMYTSGELVINLVLDEVSKESKDDSYRLFYNTNQLYLELYQLARSYNVPVLFDEKIKPDINNQMHWLVEGWQELQEIKSSFIPPKGDVSDVLSLVACDNTYTELRFVASEIRRLVVEEGYRYDDITILSRDYTPYTGQLPVVLSEYDIPYYINEEIQMKHHPLLDWIQALFKIEETFYQYRDIMRFLRTELMYPSSKYLIDVDEDTPWNERMSAFREATDYTENLVLAYGYSGSDWLSKKDWMYVPYQKDETEALFSEEVLIQEKSNKIRQYIQDILPSFYKKLKACKTGKEAIMCFYTFLLEVGVDKQFLAMEQQEIDRGNLVEAKNHEQTWQSLMDLLDEYYELLGDEPFELELFKDILVSGLEGLGYSKVPTSLDEVVVSSMDMVRTRKYKATFLIGATDQVLPKKFDNKTLLTNEERDSIQLVLSSDKYLKNNMIQSMADEPFVFYLTLGSATEKITISYPVSIDQVKDLKPSPYIYELSSYFSLPIAYKTVPNLEGADDLVDWTGTNHILLDDLVRIKRETIDQKKPLPWIWQQLEKRMTIKLPIETERLFASLTHKNIPEPLASSVVKQLYGDTIHASVSKIENFYQCQYKYFLRYGLGLKERERFELTPAETGDFYHGALDLFFKELINQSIQLTQIDDEQVARLSQSVLKQVLGERKFSILSSTNRMNYIKYQLEQTIYRVCWSLKRQAERTSMTPIQTEISFGESLGQAGLESLEIILNKNKKMKVRGKIDRVDEMMLEDDIYLSVIDYKSSKHNFDFTDAYYGLAMQMITYLDVALTQAVTLVGQEAKPAGAFYMHINNPIIPADEKLTSETIDDTILEQFKYKGLLLENEAVLDGLDKTIEPQEKSLVYPYKQLKSGKMTSSDFVSFEDMSNLIEHNRSKFKEAGNSIFSGSTLLNPVYKDQERLACEFCPYRSICQFDVMMSENNYHKIDSLKKEIILEKIKEEGSTISDD